MHDIKPKAVSLSLDPFLLRYNRHSPVSRNIFIARCDSLPSAGCINIQPMPSAIQSVFNNVGFYRSNLVSNG